MPAQLSDAARALLDGKVFVTVATLLPDGSPHQSVMWAKRDGGDVLLSTVEGRRKHLNLVKDPRITVLALSPESPYGYLEVRGTAELTTEGGRDLINELSHKYTGQDYGYDGPDDVRVVIRVKASKVVDNLSGR
jgi:PPOX class probable F420-dependent enzyme